MPPVLSAERIAHSGTVRPIRFCRPALLARQQPVYAEAAASGHERENEAAHYGEVLVEVVVLRTARGCFGELPVPVRAQGGDDHEQKQQRRDIAGRQPEDQRDPAEELHGRGHIAEPSRQPATRHDGVDGVDVHQLAQAAAHEYPASECGRSAATYLRCWPPGCRCTTASDATMRL